jgi:hypothetical protein
MIRGTPEEIGEGLKCFYEKHFKNRKYFKTYNIQIKFGWYFLIGVYFPDDAYERIVFYFPFIKIWIYWTWHSLSE